MARSQLKGKSYGTTRKVAAARQAVNRASAILGKRSAMSMAPSSTRGFYGAYRQFSRRGIPELKFADRANTILTQTFINLNGTFLLNGITQGTDYNQRIGRQITVKSILLNLLIAYDLTAPSIGSAQNGNLVRVMVIYDGQPNSGTLATGADILADQTSTTSPMNLDNRDRFKVIIDKRFNLNGMYYSTNLVAGNPTSVYMSKYKKLNLDVIFSGTANTIGSISTGAFILLVQVSDPNAAIQYWSRIRYHDN